jgi:hypothetical protein
METQKTLNCPSNSKQKVQCWRHHNTRLQTILQSHNHKKTGWYWHKNSQKDQWVRIEDPDINPCIYNQLISNKGAQNIQWRKKILFNKWCWENWISTCRRLKLDPFLSPCTNINSKWIKYLNIRSETLKQFQEAVGIGNR